MGCLDAARSRRGIWPGGRGNGRSAAGCRGPDAAPAIAGEAVPVPKCNAAGDGMTHAVEGVSEWCPASCQALASLKRAAPRPWTNRSSNCAGRPHCDGFDSATNGWKSSSRRRGPLQAKGPSRTVLPTSVGSPTTLACSPKRAFSCEKSQLVLPMSLRVRTSDLTSSPPSLGSSLLSVRKNPRFRLRSLRVSVMLRVP